MNPLANLSAAEIQEYLLKAMETGDVSPLIKEDLEIEAHSQLYEDNSTTEMTLLKNIARIKATNILHQYDTIKSYGAERGSAYMAETGLPTRSKSVYARKTVNVKMFAEWAAVTGMAALQQGIQARGTSDQPSLEQKNKRSLLMHKQNRELFFADSTKTRSTLAIDGIYALEAQDVSESTGHIIDMRGKQLRPTDIRNAAKLVTTYYGAIRQLYLSPDDRAILEANLDPAERLLMQPNLANQVGLYLGQLIDGMVTGGSRIKFQTDNILTPKDALHTSPDNSDASQFPDGVPDAVTLVSAVVTDNGDVNNLDFTSADAATDWAYRVTAKNDVGESPYVETDDFTIAAEHSFTISWTQRVGDNSYVVYRGSPTMTNGVFYKVAEIKADGNTSAKSFTDLNDTIPGTRFAFGLNINTAFSTTGAAAVQGNPALPGNTLAFAELVPMFTYALANLIFNSANELIIHPAVLEITHPFQNVIFRNVGDRAWT